VIDTARFAPDAQRNAARVPSGAHKHTVERLALSEDGTHLVYNVMLEDSAYRSHLKYQHLGCGPENSLHAFE
jgi:hypothetical protein